MISLDGRSLTLEQVRAVALRGEQASIAPEAASRMRRSRAVVERLAAGDDPVYAVNTGVGLLADVRVPPAIWNNCSATWCGRTRPASAIRCRAPKCGP